jgi:hypothetical protein
MYDDKNLLVATLDNRIRTVARKEAETMAEAFGKRMVAELELIGVPAHLNSLHEFIYEVKQVFEKKIAQERCSALADTLLGKV